MCTCTDAAARYVYDEWLFYGTAAGGRSYRNSTTVARSLCSEKNVRTASHFFFTARFHFFVAQKKRAVKKKRALKHKKTCSEKKVCSETTKNVQ